MSKNIFILILIIFLTPFLVWKYNADLCHFSINGEQWELSPPYQFDVGNLSEGEHKVQIEYIDFWLLKYRDRENKKWKWEIYDLNYKPEDADKFNEDNLPYVDKVRK